MKNKIILTLFSLCLIWPVSGPACILCIQAAHAGNSPDDPNASGYGGQTATSAPIAAAISQTNMPPMVTTNVMMELPKPNPPAALTFTNGASIGFDVLAGYNIALLPELENNTNGAWADAQINAMIPANIQALDRREVMVDGFMIPAQMENGKVTEFLLSRNPPACCYGGVTQIHEFVKVRVKSPGVDWEQYNVVRARGVLRVGAERMDGALTSVYRMDADKVEVTPEH
ncbi:MAG TPA: DUF3299 domain-containing protein [Candidatus Acidoferrales bacterium]|jgi:hypothetical protein|nr:DUF3299 domain-containing protein [Candidatus Acidoferrales bacterium]